MKVLIRLKKKHFEYDSCYHEAETEMGVTCESFSQDGNRITIDEAVLEFPPYHDGLDAFSVQKFGWEK